MPDILNQEIILKNSKRKLITNIVISGLTAVFCIISAFTAWADSDGEWAVIIIGVVALGGCIFYIKEWRDHKIEMVISREGINLRSKGFYPWSSIEMFSIDIDEGTTTLILYDKIQAGVHFGIINIKNQASVHFDITSLEFGREELIEMLLYYGQPAGLTYSKY